MSYQQVPCVNSGINIEWIPDEIDKNKSHTYIHCFDFHKAIILIIIVIFITILFSFMNFNAVVYLLPVFILEFYLIYNNFSK